MLRRTFLKSILGAFTTPYFPIKKEEQLFGWIPGHYSLLPRFRQIAPHLTNFRGKEIVALLYVPFELVTKHPFYPHAQESGDCVAHSTGGALDILTCVQVAMDQKEREKKGIKREKWITLSSTDAIYAGGRNLIANRYKGGEGMRGIWAMEYLQQYGNLLRQEYLPYDLTPYSKETVRYWDKNGLPESLLIEAKKHPLLTFAPVTTADEVRDSIAAGYPVVICSYMGLTDTRDEDGFVKPRGSWAHAMMIHGVDTLNVTSRHPNGGFCIQNSWGDWAGGPKRHNQPDGSVWVDYNIIDRNLRSMGDSYALSLFKDFPAPERDYILW